MLQMRCTPPKCTNMLVRYRQLSRAGMPLYSAPKRLATDVFSLPPAAVSIRKTTTFTAIKM